MPPGLLVSTLSYAAAPSVDCSYKNLPEPYLHVALQDASKGDWLFLAGFDTGWMGGLDKLEQYRPSEIKAGDELFSPFVAAGWKSAVERNMRPAQWLGFLKILTCLGAEYVETGFFSPMQWGKVDNVQLPQNCEKLWPCHLATGN